MEIFANLKDSLFIIIFGNWIIYRVLQSCKFASAVYCYKYETFLCLLAFQKSCLSVNKFSILQKFSPLIIVYEYEFQRENC